MFVLAGYNEIGVFYLRAMEYAVVMELADMQDLGSCVERRVGSSPTNRTICPEDSGLFFANKQRIVTCEKTI